MYTITVPLFMKALKNLKSILLKAAGEAHVRGFDIEYLLCCRLYPDQYPLYRQIRIACLEAKNSTSALSGVKPPKFKKNESDLDTLLKNIDTTIGFLESLDASDFNGSQEKEVPLSFKPGVCLTGYYYITQMVLPNFYFHTTTAYSILRHNGIPLGKKDYLGELDYRRT